MNTIILRDKEFPILFDMENLEEIQKKYGGLSNLTKLLDSRSMKDSSWVLWVMIREGVLLQNEELGLHVKPPTLKYIEKMLTPKDINTPEFITAITDTLNEYTGGNANGQQIVQAGLELLAAAKKSSRSKTSPGRTSRKKTR